MSVLAEIGGSVAYVDDGSLLWESEDPGMTKLLNGMSLEMREEGPSGADPYPAETLADEAIERFGGEILVSKPPSRKKDRIY